MTKDHYATFKGRISHAIFVLAIIGGVLIPVVVAPTSFYLAIYGNYGYSEAILYSFNAVVVGAVVIAVGWGIRWLITGRIK